MATILVIDDEEIVRATLRLALESVGHQVLEAGNGDDGLRLLDANRIDLTITDIIMPDKEGIETIIEIRRRFPRVKVIALSGVFGGLYLEMARQLGAAAALAKPVRTETLRRTVDAVLGSRVSRDQVPSLGGTAA